MTTTIKKIYIIFFLLVAPVKIFAQTYERKNQETVQDFISRNKPAGTTVVLDNALETNLWDPAKKVIVAFYHVDRKENNGTEKWVEPYVEGYVFVPIQNNIYKRVFIDSYGQEGADAEIEAVFFANANKDKAKEFFVICSWDQSSHATLAGKLYQAYVYDNINFNNPPAELTPLKQFDKIFGMEMEGHGDDNVPQHATYKTAASIRKKLKQLGY